ncbi:MAG: ferric reductase-like transmembrane domain-containing protein [Proteobacteria bacterium]|nr:ferric reductase-like transmembrane domain-containing protein [Pseudomonadota bacterium]MBS0574455.1 ferric reductase-like transmembrane domain-containing protein [Pseudomonadota bacterium]
MAGRNAAGGRSGFKIYLFWAILALPVPWMALSHLRDRKFDLVLWTGDIAGWLLIVTLCITPLLLLFGPLPGLKISRRYLGVASCLYTLLHLGIWLVHVSPRAVLQSFVRPGVLPGWLALAILLPLALTSTDAAVARMGTGWKRLQRWVYAAVILSALHWLLVTENLAMAILSFAPLAGLSLWRFWRNQRRYGRSG